jgi:EAL domain-containing protein (putative c-di-GMP-specific phosphodiesterase class I)
LAKATQSVAAAGPGVSAAGGREPFGSRPLRSFALFIGLPALLFYGLSAVLVYLALSSMAGEINRQDDKRSISSIHAALDSFLNDLSGAVSDEGTWSEAYLNVVVKPDPAWMDATWGATARLGDSYDNVLVTDQAGSIIFGENGAGPITGNISDRYKSALKMLHVLDQGIAATGDATAVSRFAADPTGAVGLAAISIHQTSAGEMTVPRQQRRILWIARHITPALLQNIAVRYQTPLAFMTSQPGDATSVIELSDADGNAVGTLSWRPDRPGDTAFNHAALIAAAVFIGIGVVLAAWLGFLRRTIARRAKAFEVSEAAVEATKQAVAGPLDIGAVAAAAEALAEADSAIAGVNAGDFTIEYQPILDLRSEALVGVEALLRWARPDGSTLAQEVLAVSDRTRLLERAGVLALRRAADEVAPLLGLMLTFAMTPEQVRSSVYAEKVSGTLAASKLPARRLQLCVDAATLPQVTEMAMPMVELRQLGVLIAVNDFAVDGKTADYLDAGLLDRVRIAARLAGGATSAPAHDAHLAASIEAARAAKAAVTITGLERKEQASRLLRLGCREFQGTLLAKPIAIAALTELILAPARPAAIRQAG